MFVLMSGVGQKIRLFIVTDMDVMLLFTRVGHVFVLVGNVPSKRE